MSTFKPMLAATVTDRAKLRFPYLASPKLDGIRCIVLNGKVLSRSLKPIRNEFIQASLRDMPNLDGELIIGSPCIGDVFNRTTRGVMTAKGMPEFIFYVFDTLQDRLAPFHERLNAIPDVAWPWIVPVPHTMLQNLNALSKYEDKVLKQGYEGVMLRGPESPYKYGRATANENSLWKLKQFTDSEVLIHELREGVKNNNAPTIDALGSTTRATNKENMLPNGKVGTIIGADLKTGELLELSPGRMNHDDRRKYWMFPSRILGKIAKYKCFNYGSIDTPRFATFQGFRDLEDIS